MQVILLEKIAHLGGVGEQVDIKAGFARNFLIPQGKAVMATKANIEYFEIRRAELEAKAAEILAKAQERAAKLVELATVTLTSKSGEEGRLFGSVNAQDIVEALKSAGVEVEKREIRLPTPIRVVGEYEVKVQLHSEVLTVVNVNVVAE